MQLWNNTIMKGFQNEDIKFQQIPQNPKISKESKEKTKEFPEEKKSLNLKKPIIFEIMNNYDKSKDKINKEEIMKTLKLWQQKLIEQGKMSKYKQTSNNQV